MSIASEWTDKEYLFKGGYIGFRESGLSGAKGGPEHAQFDNIVIKPIKQ
jgi:hypothetical protein